MPEPEACAHCTVVGGHAQNCPTLEPAKYGVVDALTPEINDAVDYDDRKTLSDVWQIYAPLPAEGLTERTYDALLHVAKWGARQALERRDGLA